jgi:hypothetical protein
MAAHSKRTQIDFKTAKEISARIASKNLIKLTLTIIAKQPVRFRIDKRRTRLLGNYQINR